MTDEKNLEKSSQDYKKSQYGSWYKKSEERKRAQIEKEQIEKKSSFYINSIDKEQIEKKEPSFFINSEKGQSEKKEESLIQKFLNIFNKK